jgi:hypothetical protein
MGETDWIFGKHHDLEQAKCIENRRCRRPSRRIGRLGETEY